MDKKQVHKMGKKINKPIKFVKQNREIFLSIAPLIAPLITSLIAKSNTNKKH